MVYNILLDEKLFFRMIYETTIRPREVLTQYYGIKNIFKLAQALPNITPHLQTHISF